MTPQTRTVGETTVRVAHEELLGFVTEVFASWGVPPGRAHAAAEALCYGDLTGLNTHGLVNLTRLYLPLFEDKRVEAEAEPRILADLGAAVLVDARRALGLWMASEAMEMAVARAGEHGVGLVSVRGGTHFGCAGHHAVRAAHRQMIGLVAANCGRQRIARPPGGRVTLLGTNPLSLAAPAGGHHPFVLDMSTTVVPTGRIRAAARSAQPVPPGWLEDGNGQAVTDPAAFDRGEAHLLWLGGLPETGAHKGFGLGLLVEVLAALVPGAGLGPDDEALNGAGRPAGRDDDIGYLMLAIAPGTLRPVEEFLVAAERLFGTVLACPPTDPSAPVQYPGWREGSLAERNRRLGVPLAASLYEEILALAGQVGIDAPPPVGDPA